jgi:membrane fusion protein, multidrug efflux system
MKQALVVGLCALLVAITGCRESAPPSPPPPPSVVVARALQRDVPIYKEWIGTTEGDVNAEIRPKIEGYLLNRLYTEGGLVRQGDPLFEIDPRQFQAQHEQAQANVAQARASLSKAQRDVARFKPLAAERAVSQQELDDALSAEQSAKAAMSAAKASVDQADLNLAWTKVVSPITGIAGLAQQQVGDLVSPQTVLTTVSTCDPIRVIYQLGEQEYLRFQRKLLDNPSAASASDVLELVLSDGTLFPQKGKVLLAGRGVDIKTGTITAVGLFPNPGNLLRPGQYAKVRAVTEVKKGAVLVPQRALSEMQGTFQVAVIGADNKAEIRPVRPAEQVGSLWIVEDGLKPGELVVIEGFSRVKSGAAVDPKEAPAEPPAEATAAASPSVAQAGR